MKQLVYGIAIGLGFVAFASCKKNTPVAVPGTTEVEITFKSPTTSTTATVGNELNVEGIIDANAWMGGWKVCIEKSNGDTLAFYEDHYEQTQYIFHYHWFPTPEDTGTVTVRVDALDVNFASLNYDTMTFVCE